MLEPVAGGDRPRRVCMALGGRGRTRRRRPSGRRLAQEG